MPRSAPQALIDYEAIPRNVEFGHGPIYGSGFASDGLLNSLIDNGVGGISLAAVNGRWGARLASPLCVSNRAVGEGFEVAIAKAQGVSLA